MSDIIFRPSPSQKRFILSKARFPAFIGGIGSGKTAVGCVKSITKLRDGDGIMVASDLPHFTKSTWPEFAKWAPWSLCTNRHLEHPFTQRKILKFEINGIERKIYYGGIEDENAWTGLNVNWAFFDEARRKRTRGAFDTLAARIRIGHNPQLWVTSSPNGVIHWMYDVFVRKNFNPEMIKAFRDAGFEGELVDTIHAKTIENKDHLDEFFLASLKGLYGGNYALQELEGEFISMEGAVWEDFSADNNATEDAEYTPGVPIEWWVDDGFTKAHPRVILYAQEVPPFVNVFDEYYALRELPEISIKRALGLGYPHPSVAYVDSSAAEMRQRLWEADIDTVGASHNIEEGIKHVAPWISDGEGNAHLRFHPRCVRSLQEIPMYVRDEQTLKPMKVNDHASDAMRYGLLTKYLTEIKEEAKAAAKKWNPIENIRQATRPPKDADLDTWYRTQMERHKRSRRQKHLERLAGI